MEYVWIKEFACVGNGIGGLFQNTKGVYVIKYKEEMATDDKEGWRVSSEDERKKMRKYDVWMPRKLHDLLYDAKIIISTCSMKKKTNGAYHSSLNAVFYEQLEGMHYNASKIALMVTNYISIRMFMVLTSMSV